MADKKVKYEILAEIADLVDKLRQGEEAVEQFSENAKEKMKETNDSFLSVFKGSFLGNFAGTLATKGLDMLFNSVGKVKSAMIDGNAQFEQYETSLKVMLGSANAASERIAELERFAAATPFELPEIVSAGNALQSLGRYSKETLTNLGDLAAGAGRPLEQATNAYAKLASGQKGIAIDMFRDMNISLDDWVSATGKGVSANGEFTGSVDDMMKALPKILEMKSISGMMEAQSATFSGLASTMEDVLAAAGRTIGKPFFDIAKSGLLSVGDFLNSEGFQNGLKSVSDSIGSFFSFISDNTGTVAALAVAIGGLVVAMNAQAMAAKLNTLWLTISKGVESSSTIVRAAATAWIWAQNAAMLAQTGTTGILTAAQTALNAAMMANPIGLIIGAVALLVGALIALYNNVEGVRVVFDAAFSAIGFLFTTLWDIAKVVFSAIWKAISPIVDVVMAVGKVVFQFMILPYRLLWEVIQKAWSIITGWISGVKGATESTGALGKVFTFVGNLLKMVFGPALMVVKAIISEVVNTIKAVVGWLSSLADSISKFSVFGSDKGKKESDAYNKEIKKGLDDKARLEKEALEREKKAAVDAAKDKGESVRQVTLAETIKTKVAEAKQNLDMLTKQRDDLKAKTKGLVGEDLVAMNKQISALDNQITKAQQAVAAAGGFAAIEDAAKARKDAILAKYNIDMDKKGIAALADEYKKAAADAEQYEKTKRQITGEDKKKSGGEKSKEQIAAEEAKKADLDKLANAEKIAIQAAREQEKSQLEIKELERSFAEQRIDIMKKYDERIIASIKKKDEREKTSLELARQMSAQLTDMEVRDSDIRIMKRQQEEAIRKMDLDASARRAMDALKEEVDAQSEKTNKMKDEIKKRLDLQKEFDAVDPVTQMMREMDAAERLYSLEIRSLNEKLDLMKKISEEEQEQLKRAIASERDVAKKHELTLKLRDKEAADAKAKSHLEEQIEERKKANNEEGETSKARLSEMTSKSQMSFARDVTDVMAGELGKAFGMQKAFAMASASMKAYEAFTTAIATYPPPLGAILGGLALASGLLQVANISKQNFTAMDKGGVAMGPTYALIGERRPETVVPLEEFPRLMQRYSNIQQDQAPTIYRSGRNRRDDFSAQVNIGVDTYKRAQRKVEFKNRGVW